jgi:hypothetical protein
VKHGSLKTSKPFIQTNIILKLDPYIKEKKNYLRCDGINRRECEVGSEQSAE